MSSVQRKRSKAQQPQQPQLPKPSCARLEIAGELTVGNIAAFSQKAWAALADSKTLVVDLGAAEYLDAAAFQCLLSLRSRAQRQGTELAFESTPASILGDAATLGMESVLNSAQVPRVE